MVEVTNREQLENWLKGRGHPEAIAIAARVALRVLPQSGQVFQHRDIKHPRTDIILAIFRATAISRSAAKSPDPEVAVAATAATAAATDFIGTSIYAADTATTVYVAVYAAMFAADATTADAAIYAADVANAAAIVDAAIWKSVSADATALEKGTSPAELVQMPLWTDAKTPDWALAAWDSLRTALLAPNAKHEDWQVWTNWYEARLRGDPVNEDLERAIAQMDPEEFWDQDPAIANAEIRRLMQEYEGPSPQPVQDIPPAPPAQRPAILQAEWRDDKVRRQHHPPEVESPAQDKRLRDAWQVLRDAFDDIMEADPGRNWPGLSKSLMRYGRALSADYDSMNVIAVGVIGEQISGMMQGETPLLEEDAGVLLGFLKIHGPFILQFPEWQAYLDDAVPEPSDEEATLSAEAARELAQTELVDEEVELLLTELADEVGTDAQPKRSAKREIVNGLRNTLSALLSHIGKNAWDGLGGGVKKTVEISVLLAVGSLIAHLAGLASLGTSFAWLAPWLAVFGVKLLK